MQPSCLVYLWAAWMSEHHSRAPFLKRLLKTLDLVSLQTGPVRELTLSSHNIYSCAAAAWVKVSAPFFFFFSFFFGVTFVHANLCKHILASTFQDVINQFPVTRLPVLNSVTESSWLTLLLPALHSLWSRQVDIVHRSITGFVVVQEPTCMHAHECRLLGASYLKS